jgi:dynein heavy chain, axonemal
VLLRNTHLTLKYLIELEQFLFKTENIDPEFRAWITKNSYWIASDVNQDHKLSSSRYASWNETILCLDDYAKYVGCSSKSRMVNFVMGPVSFALYCTAEQKFGAIGWTVPYKFNHSDLNACSRFLQNHILEMEAKKAKDITWSTVRCLISEIQYGGRVTDDWDRKQMNTYAESFFCQAVLEPGYSLLKGYSMPFATEINTFREHVNTYPLNDSPEACGLNMNADVLFGLIGLDNAEKDLQQ